MIALVMAGGKGTRMNLNGEKLLLKYKNHVISHVIESLTNSKRFSRILAATSSNAPKTKEMLENTGIEILDTSGNGYVEDLNYVLQSLEDVIFVTPGDLPLLDAQIISELVDQYNSKNVWTSFLVTNKFLTGLGIKSDYSISFENHDCHFTGISLVNSKHIASLDNIQEHFIINDDKRIALNLNTKYDYDLLGAT